MAGVLMEIHRVGDAERAVPRMRQISRELEATNRYLRDHPLGGGPALEPSKRLLDAQNRYARQMRRIAREDVRAVPVVAGAQPR